MAILAKKSSKTLFLGVYAANRPKNDCFWTPKPQIFKISRGGTQVLEKKELLVLEISTKIVQNFRKVIQKRALKILGPPKSMDLTILACQYPDSTLLLGPSYVFFSVAFSTAKRSPKRALFCLKNPLKNNPILYVFY